MDRLQRRRPGTEAGLWSRINSWWLRLRGQQPSSPGVRRKAVLALIAKHLSVLEHLEAEDASAPPGVVSHPDLELEAILLERAAIEAGDDGEGTSIAELRRREACSTTGEIGASDFVPGRLLTAKALFTLFDPARWFPPGEARIAVEPPAAATSLLECHRHMNLQARTWFNARLQCPQTSDFDAIVANRARLLERIRLFARLDQSIPPERLDILDAVIPGVRAMARPEGYLAELVRQTARNLLGDPLCFETAEAVVGQYRVIAAAIADNEQWLRLLRNSWSRSPAPETLLDALKSELRCGARLPDLFEERLAAMLTEWKKP